MKKNNESARTFRSNGIVLMLPMIAAGIALNLLGGRIVSALSLPLYLDSVGTVLTAAVGGYLPGIIVGFLSNLISGIASPTNMYYSSVSVLIAVCAAFCARQGFFRRVGGICITTLLLAVIGGGLGSFLTWMLCGSAFGDGVSAGLVQSFFGRGALSAFWSQFSADFLIDLLDKAITVLVVAFIMHLIPEELRGRLVVRGYRQAPLSRKQRHAAEERMSRGISLRAKILLLIGAATLLIAVVVSGISFVLYRRAMIEQETRMAEGVANVVERAVDPSRVDAYLAEGEAAEGYRQVKQQLTGVLMSSDDIEFVYVYRILPDGCHVVFDIDTPEVQGAAPGDVIPFDESFSDLLPDLLTGHSIAPIITDDTYGWLLTIYRPIYNEDGTCSCYAGIDISMKELQKKQQIFLARVISLFLGFFVLILAAGIWLSEYNLILPINSMAIAARGFRYDTEENRAESLARIRGLEIRTGDEIENLYESLMKTEEDTIRYIAHSEEQADKVTRLQNGLILVLADLVESRDKCTGDHVRNTAAYARIIMEQMKKDGIYADRMTDEFIEDVVNSAPLHDVGKIAVPDALLNKPGKLTDEEFARMKSHASAGGEIIAQAINAISDADSGYLREAANLAHYHHEKWNGTGYPEGLKGEEIPLSARIMAVADVFDALVSRRSYKNPFPFEKAMSIIEEGAGSHFDPNVAAAFLRAEEEVRKVTAATHGDVPE